MNDEQKVTFLLMNDEQKKGIIKKGLEFVHCAIQEALNGNMERRIERLPRQTV
jgi:hypothetical protein